ncbi:hypothetical protein NX059_000415 [Plenodomus lindquistii]|nr:hypothetical protein NX059_000415 [Plenodomus lindquistii]
MFASLTAALQWALLFPPFSSTETTTETTNPYLSEAQEARYSPAPGAQSANLKRALAEGHRIFRRDVCTDAFGPSRSSNTCNPSGTLCWIISGSLYPQCQTFLNKGWCCTEDPTCYVDQVSVCEQTGSVSCSKLAAGTNQACCPENTTCDTTINASDTSVRCRIRSAALVSLDSATISTSSTARSTASSTKSSTTTTASSAVSAASSTSPGSATAAAAPAGATSTAPQSTSVPSSSSSLSGGAIAGIVIGGVLAFALGIGAWFVFSKRQKRKQQQQQQQPHTPGQTPAMQQQPAVTDYAPVATASPGHYPYKNHQDPHVPVQELPANGYGHASELHGDVRYR